MTTTKTTSSFFHNHHVIARLRHEAKTAPAFIGGSLRRLADQEVERNLALTRCTHCGAHVDRPSFSPDCGCEDPQPSHPSIPAAELCQQILRNCAKQLSGEVDHAGWRSEQLALWARAEKQGIKAQVQALLNQHHNQHDPMTSAWWAPFSDVGVLANFERELDAPGPASDFYRAAVAEIERRADARNLTVNEWLRQQCKARHSKGAHR